MRVKKLILITAILVVIGLLTSNATISFELLKNKNEEIVSVLVYLKDQVNLKAIDKQMDLQLATLQTRHKTTVVSLQETASESQPQLINHLNDLMNQELVKEFKCFWIGNIIQVDAYQSVIEEIALRDDIQKIYPNYEIELIAPVEESDEIEPGYRNDVEIGVEAVRAPEVWNELGLTGEGVLVATIDTGVDGNHPALADRWAGVADPKYEGHPEWAWFDPYAGQNDFPYDYNGHGTHTMGTVCGGAPGDQVGVAPGAFWISAGAIDRGGGIPKTVADAIASLEWMIDPDGNPDTNWDVPAVCSNSWRLVTAHGYTPCDDLFWNYLDACEAAGTVIIFSAGNEGYSGLGRPPDRATDDYRCFAVGAVDANDPNWPIAGFSSRGPTYCTPNGSAAIKPDISAPGVNVRSSVPGGGYGQKSGTSMASPHINGVVALMREANPNIGVDEIKEIIYQTAYDLGPTGEDNDYGWGMVDAYEAVLHMSLPPDTPTCPEGPEEWVQYSATTFSSTATEPEGEDIYYMFDWGDGNYSDWVGPYASGETGEASHIWSDLDVYKIKACAKDINNVPSNWSESAILTIVKNKRPTNPDIDGNAYGFGGVDYDFTFVSTDEDGHDIFYQVEWDDGEKTEWLGPFSSGEELILSHCWNIKGTYWIKAWSKDIMEDESNQASHRIVILTNKAKTAPSYRFFDLFPIIRYILGLL
jgi:subtilisin family serine protease